MLHLPLSLLLATAPAQERVYLGTHTNGTGSHGIYTALLDPVTGALGPLTLAVEAANPEFLAITPDGHYLYASLRVPNRETVAAYAVNPDGTLTFLNEQPTGQHDGCHVSLSRDGRELFLANYGSATIESFPIQETHQLGAPLSTIPFSGSGPNQARQQGPHAHSIYADPEGRRVYSCDPGSDRIWIFRLESDGRLTPNDPPYVATAPGSGPRHLTFSPNGKFVYVSDELSISVSAYARDPKTGDLRLLKTEPCLAPTALYDHATTAEVVCDPTGKFLYVSTRNPDIISTFDLSPDGLPTLKKTEDAGVQIPRSFALDPTGRWLVLAGQQSGTLRVLPAASAPENGVSGKEAVSEVKLAAPFCVVFAPKK